MSTKYKSTGIAQFREIKDAILIPKKGTIENMDNKVLILNNVAAFMWKSLVSGVTRERIAGNVSAQYQVDEKTVEKDLSYFVTTLIHLGLLAETSETDSARSETEPSAEPEKEDRIYRHPKIYVFDLETEQETAFGPHVRGKSWVHRAVTRVWHGGCC